MNKLLLAVVLLLSIFSVVRADVELNSTQLKNATDNGLHAVNNTLDKLENKTDVLKAKIKDFFNVDNASTFEKVYKSAIVVAIAAVGAFVGAVGYKLVKPVVFISGFGLGGVFFSAVFATFFPASEAAPIVAFVVGGLLLALVCFYFYRVGIFILGGAGGMVAGLTLAELAHASHTVTVILILVFAVIAGLLAMFLEKPVMIIATANFGSWMVVRAAGFFIGSYPNGTDFDNMSSSQKKYFYGYLAATVLLLIAFSLVQFLKTAVGINHGTGKDEPAEAKKAAATTAKPNAQKPVNMV
ncbi:Aste57867_25158 [Aphanomyces stellatus]|uniref:Transmembrane protein 198 n=1 Tax=Aphanomyces stellatus TaxID=120398 RepID=A0A485LSG6_9STRA|nr:hypothetical protein As57867_025080 [Aphanomyces stellatus]VFU01787.1 Aste57867_25158 [Aphanomyces stellatus]